MDWAWLDDEDGPTDDDLLELGKEALALYPSGFCPACGAAVDDGDVPYGIYECANCGLREWIDD